MRRTVVFAIGLLAASAPAAFAAGTLDQVKQRGTLGMQRKHRLCRILDVGRAGQFSRALTSITAGHSPPACSAIPPR